MKKSLTTFTLMLLVAFTLASCKLATIRPLDPKTGKAMLSEEEAQKAFNAETYVAERWEDPLLTTVQSSAIEMSTLLSELTANSAAASEKYGRQLGSGPFNFSVKGQGIVTEVDTSSRAGLARIDLEPADGKADVAIAVGPVIKGTGLRDAMPFINFNQFVNQLEYADVSKKLHERVMKDVIGSVDLTTLQGKTVSFAGAFAFKDVESIAVTPVELKVVE
jgi:predicted lipoprotein